MPFKKILIILAAILILALIAFALYSFFRPETPLEQDLTEQDNVALTTNTDIAGAALRAVSAEPVLSPTIANGKARWYAKSNGYIFEANLDGSGSHIISSNVLPGLLKAIWSPNGNQVITLFDDQGQIKKYLYDFAAQVSTPLIREIRWLDWSPDQNKVCYQYYSPQNETNNISIANPDGSQWSEIIPTRMKDLIVEWITPEQISLREKASGLAQSSIYTLNATNKEFKKIIDSAFGLTALWSPLGDKILLSETDNRGGGLKLKLADLEESTVKELSIVTLPEKCVWSKDGRTIFCAIPEQIAGDLSMPDDWYQGKISLADSFWQINLGTQEATQITDTTDYDAKELLLPDAENYLLFVNRADGRLYSLELK